MPSNLSYKITDKTLIHIAGIERNIAVLRQNELSSRFRSRVLSEILFDDLFSISSLLNLNFTLGDIKKISIGKDIETKEARLLSNIRQIFDFIQNNFKKDQIIFNFHFVQHIVKLIQSNILEIWDVGKIRTANESPDRSFELSKQNYELSDITTLLAESILWVENDREIHPIVKACIFMMFINSTSPFAGLNFISSLVFMRLILEKYNYGNNFSIPIFKLFTNKNIKYMDIMNEILEHKRENGITDIIEALSQGLDELISEYKNTLIKFDYYDIKSSSQSLDLNERQLKVLKLLQQKVYIKRREYIKLFKVSPMTAYRDLNYLTQKNLVIVGGQGKSTTYSLATRS